MSFIYLHFILIAKMSKAPFPGNLQHPYWPYLAHQYIWCQYFWQKKPASDVIPAALCQDIPGQLYKRKVPEYLTMKVVHFAKIKSQDWIMKISQSVSLFLSVFISTAQLNVILGRSVPSFGIHCRIRHANWQSAIANWRQAPQCPACSLWHWWHHSKSLISRCISIYTDLILRVFKTAVGTSLENNLAPQRHSTAWQ
jgi:hypothetical protein